MKNNFKEFNIKVNSLAFAYADIKDTGNKVTYVINENEESEMYITTDEKISIISNDIIYNKEEFVNGFKVVKLSNNKYGYIRESDNTLLPNRYDVAFDFNYYGYAMVANSSNVTWINKEFKYLNTNGEFVEESNNISAWSKIHNFSNSKNPLSRLYNGHVAYLDTNGNLKSFRKYNGYTFEDKEYKFFLSGTAFDDSGFALIDGNFLLSGGYYLSHKELLNIMKEKGFFEIIDNDLNEKGLLLKKHN